MSIQEIDISSIPDKKREKKEGYYGTGKRKIVKCTNCGWLDEFCSHPFHPETIKHWCMNCHMFFEYKPSE
jgi:hypothetical protein